MQQLLRRLWYALRQRRHDADLTDEIEFHRAMAQRDLEADGHPATDAALPSRRRQLGNLMLVREDARAVWLPRLYMNVKNALVRSPRRLEKSMAPGRTSRQTTED